MLSLSLNFGRYKVKTLYPLASISSVYKKNKNFVGYFIAAFCGVIVQYLVGTTLLINFLGWSSAKAFWVGYIVSIPVGFFLTKLLAFDAKNSGKTQREIVKYLITLVVSGCITVYGAEFSIKVLNAWFGGRLLTIPFTNYQFSPAGTIGHFAGMGMSFIFNFFIHKKFTFNQTGIWDRIRTIWN